MADEKPWYTLKIDLKARKVEVMNGALEKLDEITSEHSTPGQLRTAIKFESFQEETLQAIREAFEAWLRQQRLGVEGDVTMTSPVVRPRPEPAPMDAMFEELRPGKGGRSAAAVEFIPGERREVMG